MKALKGRLLAIYYILHGRNFILLHHCGEFIKNNEPGFEVAVLRRTDFTTRRDFFIMAGAINVAFDKISLHVPKEVENLFDKDGKFK